MKYDENLLYNIKSKYNGTRYVLFDLAIWKNGRAFKKNDFSETGKPIIKIAELNNGINVNTAYTQGDYGDEVYIKPGDLLFSWSGNPKTSIDVFRYGMQDGWLNQHIFKITAKEEIVIKDYLYYILKYLKPRFMQIASNKQTTGLGHVTVADLKRINLVLPSKELQAQMVAILKVLDEKIENNNKINNNLEQQAQAIFKEWFIDNPENNVWSTGTFSELIKSTLNGDWGKETATGNNTEKVYCIRGADIPEVKAGNKGKMPTRYILPKNFATKQLTAGDIVVEISGGSPTQSTGRCTAITQSLLDRYDSGMVCTNFCKAMKPKEGYSLFIYYYWQYLYRKGVFFSYENGTTGIKNLDFSGFIETETILIPPADKVIAFDDYCKSIFNQIFANGKQNEHLAILRDTFLPKLMSGELDVSSIDL